MKAYEFISIENGGGVPVATSTKAELVAGKRVFIAKTATIIGGSQTYKWLIRINPTRFAIIATFKDYIDSDTEMTATVFDIDNTTGEITTHPVQSVWKNTSGVGASTSQLISNPDTGKFFMWGNNAFPGQSSNKFGYAYGRFDESGALVDTNYSTHTSYHRANGHTQGMYSNGNTGFYGVLNSYDSGDSKCRMIRIDYSALTPSLNIVNPSASDSSSYSVPIIGQKGLTNLDIVGIVYYRASTSSTYARAFNSSGSYTNYAGIRPSTPSFPSIAFALSNGGVIEVTTPSTGKAYVYTSHSSRVEVDTSIDPTILSSEWNGNIVNIGIDTWAIYSRDMEKAMIFTIDPITYEFAIISTSEIPIKANSNHTSFGGDDNQFLITLSYESGGHVTVKTIKHNMKMEI